MMSWSACLQRSATDQLDPPVSARPVASYTISWDTIQILVAKLIPVKTQAWRGQQKGSQRCCDLTPSRCPDVLLIERESGLRPIAKGSGGTKRWQTAHSRLWLSRQRMAALRPFCREMQRVACVGSDDLDAGKRLSFQAFRVRCVHQFRFRSVSREGLLDQPGRFHQNVCL